MASPAVTYTFVNGNVADASQVNQNFTDIISSLTDGTKSLNIDALTCAGAFTANGNSTLGNAVSDTITVNAVFAGTGGIASSGSIGLINYYYEDDTTLASVAWKPNGGSSLGSAFSVKVTRVGRIVTLFFPTDQTADPSGTTTLLALRGSGDTAVALPTWARPSETLAMPCLAIDNLQTTAGELDIGNTGIIYLYKLPATAFTNGTNKAGMYAQSITYSV